MIYGYARVSSREQNLGRQIEALKAEGISERNIITDKQSGKDFDRRGYNSLVGTENTAPLLREGDQLVVLSLDRLGRNYEDIRKQWLRITSELKADIRVLDMPLLDTANSTGTLDSRFLADLVLQILSYVENYSFNELCKDDVPLSESERFEQQEKFENVIGDTLTFEAISDDSDCNIMKDIQTIIDDLRFRLTMSPWEWHIWRLCAAYVYAYQDTEEIYKLFDKVMSEDYVPPAVF